ncbi:nuclear factor of activated T-cells, cytoplasmic 1-like isoform X1 [Patiria miniata]|uniref:RHD domain-containing protein n=1 Tax=Patiria miniata TaxID=46514 RepID=A0A914B0A7_PATMI|nr:nuclear factor of activated T-cells, cytoplasmic 1-like isoform X1 [Patiria miniata]
MPLFSLDSLGLDGLRVEDLNSFNNCSKGFTFVLDSQQSQSNFLAIKTDLSMNEATSDLSSVKSETANIAQSQEFNPFLSNDKVSVSDSLALLMASQITQGYESEAVGSPEESSYAVSSPMSTSCPSEPSSPFSMDSNSTASSPIVESTDHLTFDEDTISSLASLLEDDVNNNDPGFWEEEPKAKVRRTSISQLSPGSVAQVPRSPPGGFDFGLAITDPSFVCTTFNLEGPATENGNASVPVRTSTKQCSQRKAAKSKPPSLNLSFPSSDGSAVLSMLVQPEKHHRARYLTEGSRGSVKDETQQAFPTLKLDGVNEGVTLHAFVASDQGKTKPHGYYQACKVTGRNTTPCTEIDIDGTTVIEIPWECTGNNMEMSVDCVGILKLRNADVEQRIGLARSKRKSTTVRLVFRVFLKRPDGSVTILQETSSPICCTQPLGHPEIVKKSLTSCSVKGDEDMFIIGKNFIAKHTKVKLQELCPLGKVLWEGNCEIDKALFHNTHIVCKVPPYKALDIDRPKEVYLVVTSGPSKTSELYAHPFNYMPLSESGRKPEIIPVQMPVVNGGAVNVVESALSPPMVQPMQPISVAQSQACVMDGGKSFADTLKAAAQLELKSPGLLAKLAHQDPNISSLLGLISESSNTAALVLEQPVFKELIQLGIVGVKQANNEDEVGIENIEEMGVVLEEGTSQEMSLDEIDNLLVWWKEQAHFNQGSVPTATLDDVSSVLSL